MQGMQGSRNGTRQSRCEQWDSKWRVRKCLRLHDGRACTTKIEDVTARCRCFGVMIHRQPPSEMQFVADLLWGQGQGWCQVSPGVAINADLQYNMIATTKHSACKTAKATLARSDQMVSKERSQMSQIPGGAIPAAFGHRQSCTRRDVSQMDARSALVLLLKWVAYFMCRFLQACLFVIFLLNLQLLSARLKGF